MLQGVHLHKTAVLAGIWNHCWQANCDLTRDMAKFAQEEAEKVLAQLLGLFWCWLLLSIICMYRREFTNHVPSGFLVGAGGRKSLLKKGFSEMVDLQVSLVTEDMISHSIGLGMSFSMPIQTPASELCVSCAGWQPHGKSFTKSHCLWAKRCKYVWQRHRAHWQMRRCRLVGTCRSSLNKSAWQNLRLLWCSGNWHGGC